MTSALVSIEVLSRWSGFSVLYLEQINCKEPFRKTTVLDFNNLYKNIFYYYCSGKTRSPRVIVYSNILFSVIFHKKYILYIKLILITRLEG